MCCSGLVLNLAQLNIIEVILTAGHPLRKSRQESRPHNSALLSPFAISVFMCPFSWGFDNVIKIFSSRGSSGMPGVPLLEEHDARKLNNPQDIR